MKPHLMWDGKRWWVPCPYRRWRHYELTEHPDHVRDSNGLCWNPAEPQAFRRW